MTTFSVIRVNFLWSEEKQWRRTRYVVTALNTEC